MVTHLELQIFCPPDQAAYLTQLLWTLDGVEAVAESYRKTERDHILPEDLQWLAVTTQNPALRASVEGLLQSEPALSACRILAEKPVREEDWAESWKQHWHVTRVHEALVIVPRWEEYTSENPDEVVIPLDPGCAFGTGTHETTCLVLNALWKLSQRLDFSQVSMLDVGTGSGILAIYAAKLGCRSILAIDNDPQAVQAAEENMIACGVDAQVMVSEAPLAELCQTKHEVILANIIAPVILELLPDICLRLAPGGTLLASGLIEKSVGQVEAVLENAGFTEIQRTQQGDWYALEACYQP